MDKCSKTPWRRTSRVAAVDNEWLRVYRDSYLLPDGAEVEDFCVIEERAGVNVVALTRTGDAVLVEQYRPAVRAVVYDFPGGYVEDDGTSLLDQAKRELVEETGYTSTEWYSLGHSFPAPHRMDKTEHFFLALDINQTRRTQFDKTEYLNHSLVPLETLEDMILCGEFHCGVCMSSLLLSTLKLRELGKTFPERKDPSLLRGGD